MTKLIMEKLAYITQLKMFTEIKCRAQIELVNNRLFPPLRVFNWDFSKVIRR